VTNSYLALYPHKYLAERFAATPSLKRTVWEMLNNLTADSMLNEGRTYGGGLRKIEPKELLNIDVPFFENLDIPLFETYTNLIIINQICCSIPASNE